MKNIIYLFLFASIAYSQCEHSNEFECDSDISCQWIATYQWYDCDNFQNSTQCNSYSQYGCYWDSHWYYSGWSDCDGPSFQIETGGYCQEIEMPECSEMEESECTSNDSCDWVENIELQSCNDINSQQECNAVGCSWYSGNYYACSICCWGEYEVDNGYCEESDYQLGDLNQDSTINIQDVIIVINLILNGEFDLAADINLDNSVNVLDVIQLVNIILS